LTVPTADLAFPSQHDVAGLKVAMGDASAVRLVEGVRDLNRNLEGDVELDPPSRDACRERLAYRCSMTR
jgi:hypothetical protein